MIHYLIDGSGPLLAFVGILFAFGFTCLMTTKFAGRLPRDMGRDFAVDGKLSAGKPRGAGLIFILVFAVSALLFSDMNLELFIYLAMVVVEMLTGYLDDASDKPWGEYKKGFLDFLVAVIIAVTFLKFNSSSIELATIGITVTLPPVLFGILAVILVWVSINVTNCSDGVDGLSGTLTIVSLMSIYVIGQIKKMDPEYSYIILLFVVCILGYLWYNASPSILMMGDAGSRAMGIFIAIAAMKTGSPFLYLLIAGVLLLDGGLGLAKVFLLRFFKIHILKNTRTPLHDHVRKVLGWSNTQTVFRFTIIQIVISVATVYLLMMSVIR